MLLNTLGSLTEQVDKLEVTVESLKDSNDHRFVNRIPNNLKECFNELGYASFDKVAGDNNIVDHKEIKGIGQSVVA